MTYGVGPKKLDRKYTLRIRIGKDSVKKTYRQRQPEPRRCKAHRRDVFTQRRLVLTRRSPEVVGAKQLTTIYCPIAQLAERRILVPKVLGSTPNRATLEDEEEITSLFVLFFCAIIRLRCHGFQVKKRGEMQTPSRTTGLHFHPNELL